MTQPELPLYAERQHGDTATCRRCGQTVTYFTDAIRPYWLHPNRCPYCKAADGSIGPAEPEEMTA